MNTHRPFVLALATAALCTAAFAQPQSKQVPQATTVVSKVVANDFVLKETAKKTLADGVSTSVYTGETVFTVTSADASVEPVQIPVKVELRTQTRLNASGDGLTDGALIITAPSTRQAICGSLLAVNENFGDLTGVIEGRLFGSGNPQVSLRAVFHGVFTQDADGNYSIVKVSARGVQVAVTRGAKTGK